MALLNVEEVGVRFGGVVALDSLSFSVEEGQICALIGAHPDLTLNEIASALHKRRIPVSRSALSRFFARHGITFKKKPAGGRAQASRGGSRAATLDPRARLA